jgi:putative ABC transport system ATP-binding protein
VATSPEHLAFRALRNDAEAVVSPNGSLVLANGCQPRGAAAYRGGMHPNNSIVHLRGVSKRFPAAGGSAFTAIASVDLEIACGEFVAVVGPSGSGKSTLLNLLAGIERADDGELHVAGADLHTLNESQLASWRGRAVGVVFQFFQLLPTLTALENVMLPMDFCRIGTRTERAKRALDLLQRLGVDDQANKFPAAMSGGQQQRVAVARALANSPRLLLADEPTGNLDSTSAESLLDLLAGLVRDTGIAVAMVTHEAAAMRRASRRVLLHDGRIVAAEAADA